MKTGYRVQEKKNGARRILMPFVFVWVIGIWELEFVGDLVLVIWNFIS
jgi:hypothetical protein